MKLLISFKSSDALTMFVSPNASVNFLKCARAKHPEGNPGHQRIEHKKLRKLVEMFGRSTLNMAQKKAWLLAWVKLVKHHQMSSNVIIRSHQKSSPIVFKKP